MKPSRESPFLLVGKSKIHRKGVFARTNIPKDLTLIEYSGEKISRAECVRRDKAQKGAFYVFVLNKDWGVDGASGGDAKFINHSCTPNCRYFRRNGKIWIRSIRNIKQGEEITYDYCADGEHQCNCRSKNCSGLM
jgi:SET domain-containing protein